VPPLSLPPEPQDAILGTLTGAEFDRVAAKAPRTAPPRENGGNQDNIKHLTTGSRVFYPVYVPGASLSVGDLHFSQGDGEITFCGAIEMGGFIDLHVDLIKNGMQTYGVTENAIFLPGNAPPRFSQWLAFSGISVTLDDEQSADLCGVSTPAPAMARPVARPRPVPRQAPRRLPARSARQ